MFRGSRRCAGAWLLVTGVALGMGALLMPALTAGPHVDSFDAALVRLSAVVAAGVTAWLWLAASVVALDAARGHRLARRGVPRVLRRGLLVLCGAAVATGLASPAALATGGPLPGPTVLSGLRLPERVAVRPVGPAARPAPPPPVGDGRVVVERGDSLWSLTERRLGPDATAAEVQAAWPRLYAANRDLIGPDPGLLEPGQRLVVPDEEADR